MASQKVKATRRGTERAFQMQPPLVKILCNFSG
jgi:hypothetical protein